MKSFFTLALFPALGCARLAAATLDQAEITEVVNHVRVIEPGSRATHAARLHEQFRAPNVLRTGPDSRAELVSADHTVTRVGSNTVFSFQADSREMELERGSVLFQSPSGRGGGTIHTPAASAAVLGTTMIVSASANGAMKVLLLEGKGKVTVPSGKSVALKSGQMAIVLPGGRLGPVQNFQLGMQVSASRLVQNFRAPLPSAPRIAEQVRIQERQIRNGELGGTQNPPPPRNREEASNPPPPPPPPPFAGPAGPQPPVQARDAMRQSATPPPPPPRRQERPPPR